MSEKLFGSEKIISRNDVVNGAFAFQACFMSSYLKYMGIEDDTLFDALKRTSLASMAIMDNPKIVEEFEPDIFELYLKAKGYTITDND